MRALPAGLVVLAITRTLPRGQWWWRAALLGTLNIGAFLALLFVAAYRLPGGVAATLGAAQPLLIAGLGIAILGERPTRWRVGWGIAGVLAFTGWQLTAGGLLLAPLALVVAGPLPPLATTAVAGYAYLAIVGTLLVHLLWCQGLERLPIGATSFLPLLAPVVATSLGWGVLGQSLNPVQGIGFALALVSVGAAPFAPTVPPKPTPLAVPPVRPAH